MRAYTLCSAAAAAVLAGLARAEIELRFFEGLDCTDTGEAVAMKFHQDQTVHFDRPVYRAVMSRQIEGARCQWTVNVNGGTAQDRPADATRRRRGGGGSVGARAEPVRELIDCTHWANDLGQSLAVNSVQVYNC